MPDHVVRCRGCGGPMRWAQNETTGRRVPIDPDPVPDGNLVLVALRPGATPLVRYLRKHEPVAPTSPRYVSHFATCPQADQFRK